MAHHPKIYAYGPNDPMGSKIKSTRDFLERFLSLLKKRRPCNVTYAAYNIMWEMRREMMAADSSQSFDKKCARIYGNGLQRIMDCYCHHNKDATFADAYMEVCMLTIDEYISLVEAAIELPREYCRDGSTS